MISLCRLCLHKDNLNVPIFEDQANDRQVFFKINACLPVKISQDDQLPKIICDGCLHKLDMLYEFRQTSAKAEKTLLSWLEQFYVKGTKLLRTVDISRELSKEELNKAVADKAQEVNLNFILRNEEYKVVARPTASEASRRQLPSRRSTPRSGKTQNCLTSGSDDNEDDDMNIVDPNNILTGEINENNESDGDNSEVSDTMTQTWLTPGSDDNEDDDMSIVEPNSMRKDEMCENNESDGDDCEISDTNDEGSRISSVISNLNENTFVVKESAGTSKKSFYCAQCNEKISNLSHLKKHKAEECIFEIASKITEPTFIETKLNVTNLKKTFPGLCNVSIRKVNENECSKPTKLGNENVLGHTFKNVPKSDIKRSTMAKTIYKSKFPKSWSCNKCSEIFTSSVHLNAHEQSCRVDINSLILPKPNYDCKQCGKGFLTQDALDDHENVHLGRKPYICDVCSQDYSNRHSLRLHLLKSHTAMTGYIKRKPLEKDISTMLKVLSKTKVNGNALCEICGKKFETPSQLQRHIDIHLGVKNYACKYCGRRFGGISTLKKHERIHTGEKPYKCQYCGKRFRQDQPFKVHLRTHTGERPYVCQICNKGFITNQMRKKHLMSCKGELPVVMEGGIMFVDEDIQEN